MPLGQSTSATVLRPEKVSEPLFSYMAMTARLECAWLHRKMLWAGPAGLRRGPLPDLWWTHLGMFLVAPILSLPLQRTFYPILLGVVFVLVVVEVVTGRQRRWRPIARRRPTSPGPA